VIEGEAPMSGGERSMKGPMIYDGEFSTNILLVFSLWLWRLNVVVLLIREGEDER
jgi:hypothetical protein